MWVQKKKKKKKRVSLPGHSEGPMRTNFCGTWGRMWWRYGVSMRTRSPAWNTWLMIDDWRWRRWWQRRRPRWWWFKIVEWWLMITLISRRRRMAHMSVEKQMWSKSQRYHVRRIGWNLWILIYNEHPELENVKLCDSLTVTNDIFSPTGKASFMIRLRPWGTVAPTKATWVPIFSVPSPTSATSDCT